MAGFPEPGLSGQGEQRHPGQQVECELDDLQPDPVLGRVVQGKVARAGCAGGPDAVFGPCPLSVPQFECGDRDAGGVGGETGEPQAVGVGEPQLGARVWPFLADDQPQPLRPTCQAVSIELGDPCAVADLAAWFDVGVHAESGTISTAW